MRLHLTFDSLRKMIGDFVLSKEISLAELPVVFGVNDKPIGTVKFVMAVGGKIMAELHLDDKHRLLGPSPIADFYPQAEKGASDAEPSRTP